MSNTAIQLDHLSKQYRIGSLQQGGSKYKSLREELTKAVRAPIRRAGRLLRGEPYGAAELDETIWALRDVSFEVKHGEVLGIIGANGAGKTTLLKILSRITEPTGGRAVLHGRVGSLLEVGTGFHPELTGRENTYLNGAILGMTKTEIERKFDEIVDFSGVEQFIDTPVKHYSSGMRVRLAFSVAAHLDPEILLIDEVLAVGDADFQKKCLGKMGDVAMEGRTVVFVSHNMGAVEQLCDRCLLISEGRIELNADPKDTIAHYLDGSHEIRGPIWNIGIGEEDHNDVRIRSVVCEPASPFIGAEFSITIHYSVGKARRGLMFGVSIEGPLGRRIIGSYTGREGVRTGDVQGRQAARVTFRRIDLLPGTYQVTVTIHDHDGENIVRVERAASFEVMAKDLTGSGYLVDGRNGLVWLDHEWEIEGANSP